MLDLLITQAAQRDMDDLAESVFEFTYSVSSVESLQRDLYQKMSLISFMPLAIGRKIENENAREAFCRGYRIVYDVTETAVIILSVVHSSRIRYSAEFYRSR